MSKTLNSTTIILGISLEKPVHVYQETIYGSVASNLDFIGNLENLKFPQSVEWTHSIVYWNTTQ